MFRNIMNRVFNPLKKILTKKLRKKIKYRSVKKAEDILKDIDERIKNEFYKTTVLIKEEEKRKIAIEILRETLEETPNYYTEEEFNIILNELGRKETN